MSRFLVSSVRSFIPNVKENVKRWSEPDTSTEADPRSDGMSIMAVKTNMAIKVNKTTIFAFTQNLSLTVSCDNL